MKLIVDSGSTKTDWIAINDNGETLFQTQTLGLNPQVLSENILEERIRNNYEIYQSRKDVYEIYFYGAGCGTEPPKKLIKKAIKNKASYIALGAFFSTKTKLVKYRANIKTLKWAKKTTNIPIVAIGGIKFDNYKKLLLNKANFLAISSYIWNNKKYKPLEAINKLK